MFPSKADAPAACRECDPARIGSESGQEQDRDRRKCGQRAASAVGAGQWQRHDKGADGRALAAEAEESERTVWNRSGECERTAAVVLWQRRQSRL